MERKIGEIFEFGGEWYQCIVGSECENCAFGGIYCYNFTDNNDSMGYCSIDKRKDNKEVIFKKLKKVGEPFIGKVLRIQFQRYKIYTKPIIDPAENVNYVNEGDTIAIEIKQKEDMEENKLNLKPFDIQKAREGKPVCTRGGRTARIIYFDAKGDYPIVALIETGNGEKVVQYMIDGHCTNIISQCYDDLMMLPEKKEGWVNIYDDMVIYESEEGAKMGIATARNYIATTKVEWGE